MRATDEAARRKPLLPFPAPCHTRILSLAVQAIARVPTGLSARLALAALLTTSPATAQSNLATDADPGGPRAALDRFLLLNASARLAGAEGRSLLAGELARGSRPTVGPLPSPDRLVMLVDGTAVARLPAQDEDRPDLYLYLRQREEGGWQIHALRSLALMGIPRELRRLLRASPSRSAEEDERLRNVELTLASDQELRSWFAAHLPALERLRRMAESRAGTMSEDGGRRVDTPEAAALLRELHALMLSVSASGVTSITIGGMVDNEVGFLHAADPAIVPPIDDGNHIWIEPVGGGWYLFRTT